MCEIAESAVTVNGKMNRRTESYAAKLFRRENDRAMFLASIKINLYSVTTKKQDNIASRISL